MFCSACGNKVEEKASFCSHCGKPVGSQNKPGEPTAQTSTSEICEITWEKTKDRGFFSSPRARFFARAIGARGKFTAAESDEFSLLGDGMINSEDPATMAVHENFVLKLVEDGWQPTEGTSAIGFNCKFKRTVSVQTPGPLELYFFWSPWADPCKQAMADLAGLVAEFPGILNLKKIDADVNRGAAERFKITGLPTYIFLKSGRECERILGALPREKVAEVVKRLA